MPTQWIDLFNIEHKNNREFIGKMDITDAFIYQNTVWEKTECEFLLSVFHQYRGFRDRLALFFGEHPFQNDLTKIKQMVERALRQETLLYLARENVDVLKGESQLYNMCIRKITESEKQLGIVVFKNDDEIHSTIQFVFCLTGALKITVLNKNISLEPGQILLFPSSWVFPYQYAMDDPEKNTLLVEGFCYQKR